MKWPTIEQFSAMTPLPEGYRLARLQRSDIPALIEAIKLWHPDIVKRNTGSKNSSTGAVFQAFR